MSGFWILGEGVMDFSVHKHRLSALSDRFNLMVLLVFGLLITNVMLGGLLYQSSAHQKIEITPFFEGRGYTKSNASVDATYLEMMSENFIYSRLNVTPETVAAHHENILKYISNQHFSDIEKELLKEKKVIQSLHVSSDFVIESLKADPNTLKVIITGVLKRFVGFQSLKEKKCAYVITYRYQLGRLTIDSFLKVKEENHE